MKGTSVTDVSDRVDGRTGPQTVLECESCSARWESCPDCGSLHRPGTPNRRCSSCQRGADTRAGSATLAVDEQASAPPVELDEDLLVEAAATAATDQQDHTADHPAPTADRTEGSHS